MLKEETEKRNKQGQSTYQYIITLPLTTSPSNKSAITPPKTLTGGDPTTPARNRSARNPAQLPATACPSDASTKSAAPVTNTRHLPMKGDSLSGALVIDYRVSHGSVGLWASPRGEKREDGWACCKSGGWDHLLR